ncbi:hypothetical protein [Kiloniella antarctica]|uniref:Uncharacterized protein n=1 Tax=Kiloniella antarctica TaxID=1550907 RepID=A0ABW5BNL0_9PROT
MKGLDLITKTLQSAAMNEEEKSEHTAGESLKETEDRSQKSITSEKAVAERTTIRLSREAKALRDNLRKRKGQLRERK